MLWVVRPVKVKWPCELHSGTLNLIWLSVFEIRWVSSTLMLYLLYRSEALGANIHIHSILPIPNSIIVNTHRQRENPKWLHNASAHNCSWALYNWKSFVEVSWGIIIQAMHMSGFTKIYMQWSRTFTFYWILDLHLNFATDVDSNIVDLMYRVRLLGMRSSVLTAARTHCLCTGEKNKDFHLNNHFVKTAVYFK